MEDVTNPRGPSHKRRYTRVCAYVGLCVCVSVSVQIKHHNIFEAPKRRYMYVYNIAAFLCVIPRN